MTTASSFHSNPPRPTWHATGVQSVGTQTRRSSTSRLAISVDRREYRQMSLFFSLFRPPLVRTMFTQIDYPRLSLRFWPWFGHVHERYCAASNKCDNNVQARACVRSCWGGQLWIHSSRFSGAFLQSTLGLGRSRSVDVQSESSELWSPQFRVPRLERKSGKAAARLDAARDVAMIHGSLVAADRRSLRRRFHPLRTAYLGQPTLPMFLSGYFRSFRSMVDQSLIATELEVAIALERGRSWWWPLAGGVDAAAEGALVRLLLALCDVWFFSSG